MLKIGLTGGIGSGKSTASQCFSDLGVPLIDADIIAHQLTQPKQPALVLIADKFGASVINCDGTLDRQALRELVFSHPQQKAQLEAILHPLIYQEINRQVARLSVPYCVIAIPLLIETGKLDFVDRVLVIDCPVEQQIERVKKRNSLTEQQISAIIANQASRNNRLAVANDIIDNSKTTTHLAEQVKNLHNLYILLSST